MRVIISAGGTGGHIYPALAIVNCIKEKEPKSEFLYIGTHNRMEKDIVPKYDIPFIGIEMYDSVIVRAVEKTDELYAKGIDAGALGGKLLGAGGGGFLVFYVEPEYQQKVREAMSDLLYVPFEFENGGTRVIHYTPETYEHIV